MNFKNYKKFSIKNIRKNFIIPYNFLLNLLIISLSIVICKLQLIIFFCHHDSSFLSKIASSTLKRERKERVEWSYGRWVFRTVTPWRHLWVVQRLARDAGLISPLKIMNKSAKLSARPYSTFLIRIR